VNSGYRTLMSRGRRESEQGRISVLVGLVGMVEAALESQQYKQGRPIANELARSTGSWIEEVQHDPSVDAELTAALKIFRNAAFAFRQLSKASRGAKNIAMAGTCGTLIAQGRDVLRMYTERHGLSDEVP
jgi:hypothetical protein